MLLLEGWLWLGGSLFGAIAWANIVWLVAQLYPQATGKSPKLCSLIIQLLRLVYYVGLPFSALLWGRDTLITRLFGLQPLALPPGEGEPSGPAVGLNWRDWAGDIGWAVLLAVLACGIMGVAWLTYRRMVGAYAAWPIKGSDSSTSLLLREAIYHEVHWAFYRHMPVVALGTYWGTWGGLGLVALEALLNPAWHSDLADPLRAPERLMRASMAVVSALLFLMTENLWLGILVHWLVSRALLALVRAFPGYSTDIHSATAS
ncbi:MAG: hypothetical protein N2508_05960 [Anaerolineae bacterium]|nr:hypothetical protein [Anaerolineae bacterium]